MNVTPPSAKALFLAAINLPPEERPAFLREQCGTDDALRDRVESLVAAHVRVATQPPDPDATASLPRGSNTDTADMPGPVVGAVVGPYHLRELIGEGGMGLVFVAEQTDPVRRKVALKVIKPGMDSKQVVARFEAERQALALMDHPNIARVLDGGTTPDGRPFFVMELVKGQPVTDFCDANRLTLHQRLALFSQVCRAVQHAHQKGVIHRDLKPSNVLVAIHDVEPVAKVIDFGIAKAVGQQLTDKTVYTGIAQLIGTPLYMSPEQAGQSSLDVDTRTDVYALGVLLYELLTGTTPIDPEAVRKAGYDELRRIIREDEPARPSARLSTLNAAALSTVADKRGTDPGRLARVVRGELDWVVMKCLEKDRNRRYESVGALAADLDRYLRDEPVQACPPSGWYRLRKFTRRNRAALATTAVLLVGVLSVAAAVGWGVWDSAQRRAAAERDATVRREAAEAAATVALAESADHYRAGRPDAAMASGRRAVDTVASVPGGEHLLTEARQRVTDLEMAARLEDLWLRGLDDNGVLGREAVAALAHAVFREYGLDPTELAEAELVERIRDRLIAAELVAGLDVWAENRSWTAGKTDPLAVKLHTVATAADPDPWSRRVRDAARDRVTAQLLTLARDIPVESAPPTAVAELGLAMQRARLAPTAAPLLRRAARVHPDHLQLNFVLGDLLRSSPVVQNRVEALGYCRAALALRPRSPTVLSAVGISLTDYLGRYAEGEQVFRDVLRLRPDYPTARHNLAIALAHQARHAEALPLVQAEVAADPGVGNYTFLGDELAALGRQEDAAKAYSAALEYKPTTGKDHYSRGRALEALRRVGEAIPAFREAVRLDPSHFRSHIHLGQALGRSGQLDEALTVLQRAVTLRPESVEARGYLGDALALKGRTEEAITAYREAARLDPRNPAPHFQIGTVLAKNGRAAEAVPALREAIRLKPDDAEAHVNLGNALLSMKQRGQAIESYRTAVLHKPDLVKAHYPLAIALMEAGRTEDALPYLRLTIRYSPDHAEAYCNLGNALEYLGRRREALPAFRRGHELGSPDPKWPYPSARWIRECAAAVAVEELAGCIRRAFLR